MIFKKVFKRMVFTWIIPQTTMQLIHLDCRYAAAIFFDLTKYYVSYSDSLKYHLLKVVLLGIAFHTGNADLLDTVIYLILRSLRPKI